MPGKGRPHKTIEEHKRDGTYRADRHGGMAFSPEGYPDKPDDLDENGEWFWEEQIAPLMQKRIIGRTDASQIIQMIHFYQEYHKAYALVKETPANDEKYGKYLINLEKLRMNFDRISCRFGMTPADRMKVAPIPDDKQKGKSGLAAEKPVLAFPGGAG